MTTNARDWILAVRKPANKNETRTSIFHAAQLVFAETLPVKWSSAEKRLFFGGDYVMAHPFTREEKGVSAPVFRRDYLIAIDSLSDDEKASPLLTPIDQLTESLKITIDKINRLNKALSAQADSDEHLIKSTKAFDQENNA